MRKRVRRNQVPKTSQETFNEADIITPQTTRKLSNPTQETPNNQQEMTTDEELRKNSEHGDV